MSKLQHLIERSISNHLGQLNTLMICKVVQVIPWIEIVSYFDAKYLDNESKERTKIQRPMLLEGVSVQVGDIVLTGFLQEFVEGGATRKFDISDAVILGKVSL